MSSRSATTVVALTAGLTAVLALRHRAARLSAAMPAPRTPAAGGPGPVPALPARDGVVLPFVRPVPAPAAAPQAPRPAAPVRCGDSGGRTKAGAPCGARASAAGRCHHHQVAA